MRYQNFYATRLFTDIGASDTTIELEAAPVATSGRLTLEARNATQREIVKYTGVSGNQITGVTRGQGGTAAKPHPKGALAEMNLTAEDIEDLYDAFDSFAASQSSWFDTTATISSVTNTGAGRYSLAMNSDMSAVLSPGMRLRTTRTVPAPTRSAHLNGTSHYFTKTSPAGMTFTDDFSASAWVKLDKYDGSLNQIIVSRYSTSGGGWRFEIDSTGYIRMLGLNGNGSNVSYVTSEQQIPLGRWTHVAAQLDMSAYSATPTTSYVMIDGVNVPSRVARSGTNPTSLTQAGDLSIGYSTGGGTVNYFPGRIAQVAVFSTKVTQDTMRSYMSQSFTGSEPGLISAYSFDNSLADIKAATANNLTAQGGATANSADSPFGTQGDGSISSTLDYAIIHSVSPSTIVAQTIDGNTIPTSGGIDSISYSTQEAPYNFRRHIGTGFPDMSRTISVNHPSGTVTNGLLFVAPEDGFLGGHMNNIPAGFDTYVRYGAADGQIIQRVQNNGTGSTSWAFFVPVAKGDSLYVTKSNSVTGSMTFFPEKRIF